MIYLIILLLNLINVYSYATDTFSENINPICKFNYNIYDYKIDYNYKYDDIKYKNHKDYYIEIIDLNKDNKTDVTKLYDITKDYKYLSEKSVLDILVFRYLYNNIGCNCILFRQNQYKNKMNICFYYFSLDDLINDKVSIKIFINNILKSEYKYNRIGHSDRSLRELIKEFKIMYYNINYYNPNIEFNYLEKEIMIRDSMKFSRYIHRLWFDKSYIKYKFI